MIKTPFIAAAAALIALSACNQNKPEEVSGVTPDPMGTELANRAPVVLPPSIAASKSMRCGDNSLVFVDFYEGDKQALVKTSKDGPGTMLVAPAAGEPYVADGGFKLTGNSKSATVVTPNEGTRTCKA